MGRPLALDRGRVAEFSQALIDGARLKWSRADPIASVLSCDEQEEPRASLDS